MTIKHDPALDTHAAPAESSAMRGRSLITTVVGGMVVTICCAR